MGNLYHEHVSESLAHTEGRPEALWFVNIMIITAYVPHENINLRQEDRKPLQQPDAAALTGVWALVSWFGLSMNRFKPHQTGLSRSSEPFGGEIKH